MAEPFSPVQAKTEERNWAPIVIGLIAVLIVVGIIVGLTRNKESNGSQIDPYAAKLKLSNAKVSAAENYVGGTVTYLDVGVTNTGDHALVGAAMHAVFKNTLNEVVQNETLPLHVLVANQMGGYDDLADLSRVPIAPGQTKTLRMTLEHVSADWDQSVPTMQLVDLHLK